LFYYKDRDTQKIAHFLDLEEYGVIKKWMIVTEISKEVENNIIGRLVNAYSMCLELLRVEQDGRSAGDGVAGGSH
jgi:hypothetical protein